MKSKSISGVNINGSALIKVWIGVLAAAVSVSDAEGVGLKNTKVTTPTMQMPNKTNATCK